MSSSVPWLNSSLAPAGPEFVGGEVVARSAWSWPHVHVAAVLALEPHAGCLLSLQTHSHGDQRFLVGHVRKACL